MRIVTCFSLGFVALLSACSTPAGGNYVKRTSDTYDFQVGAARGGGNPDESFYRGAYEICKREKTSGFQVISKQFVSRQLLATVKCAGPIDKDLVAKYGDGPKVLEVSPSPVFSGGYEYTFDASR
ncbi:MAG: hypothetical protein EOP06_03400 [Proteobacteria bacterium]|nr:MAG: hypothetical protein EOP06_03400 [Pseudomonadota bacterium]